MDEWTLKCQELARKIQALCLEAGVCLQGNAGGYQTAIAFYLASEVDLDGTVYASSRGPLETSGFGLQRQKEA